MDINEIISITSVTLVGPSYYIGTAGHISAQVTGPSMAPCGGGPYSIVNGQIICTQMNG
jgi:hypothetical protein